MKSGGKAIIKGIIQEIKSGDFPGSPVVKNPPSNAEGVGSIPDRGTKIPHAIWQLALSATTTEPMFPRAH